MSETAVRVGVIGGSGVYDVAELEGARDLSVQTPFGPPSDDLRIGSLAGVPTAFIARHGRKHRFMPTEIPYRANLYALRSLGVHHVLSISAVGSLKEQYAPGEFVLADQFIDRTTRRESTFFGNGIVGHLPYGEPVCASMQDVIAAGAEGLDVRVHRNGTYVCIEGPQFSTRAESELYRSWGCDVVGMTNATEAKLAREAGVSYATIAMVTDYDCWHPDHSEVDVADVIKVARQNAKAVREIIVRAVPGLATLPDSPWRNAVRQSVLTPADAIPAEARERTAALFADN